MKTYPALRTIHLICGVFSVPALLMYGVSAVQMAHSKWFNMKPAVVETDVPVRPGIADGRQLANELMTGGHVHGEIAQVRPTPTGFDLRITVPGTVSEVRYDRTTGVAHVRKNVAGPMGMLNRLHHAAGFRHDFVPLQIWGFFVALISAATIGLGATGLWMWWLRRQDRRVGIVLLSANLIFAVVILTMLRTA